ncbi:Nucleic-acid-binding protein from transposon X-element, partial [Stegodyphus mimosarum]
MHRVKTRAPMSLFQVQLSNAPGVQQIYDIVKFMDFYVKIVVYQSNGSAVQCHNCQHFHHSSDICKLKPKCAGPRKTEDCSAKRLDTLKCCNCFQVGHTANYRGCPKFPVNNNVAKNNSSPVNNKNIIPKPKQTIN